MLHSGLRGVGNAIGSLFITLAQADMRQHLANLPDKNLAYFKEGSRYFDDYMEAVGWTQRYARSNREVMMNAVIDVVRATIGKPFAIDEQVVNCHYNYVQKERHFGTDMCSMSRKEAKRSFTVKDQISATVHVECRKDAGVIDEIPMACKDIDAAMAAQRSLVEVVHTLRRGGCVKGSP